VEAVENAMEVVEVLPNEASDARIFGDNLKGAILKLVASQQAFDGAVISKRESSVQNLRLENEGDIAMEDCHGIGPALR
jgi:hypothetical protein